jgi:hypothetical protein
VMLSPVIYLNREVPAFLRSGSPLPRPKAEIGQIPESLTPFSLLSTSNLCLDVRGASRSNVIYPIRCSHEI